jgi:N-acetylglucosaminyldiphosphoundecaprenol N-acetyl-beta-D-mannosaminyltransferase
MIDRYPILNIWCDNVTMHQALAKVSDFVENGNGLHTIFASNPEKNYSVRSNPLVYELFQKADMLIPDGIGVVMAARVLYGIKLERVSGCDLMQSICALSAAKGYRIFFFGAREDVSRKAVEELCAAFTGLQVVGRANGYLPEEAMHSLVREINDSGAQILFVALGSPKQEQWLARYMEELQHVRVCQGIGGTLDVLAGAVARAPEAFCCAGLEWLYRLLSEPRRMKRQLVLPLFALRVLTEKKRMIQSLQSPAHERKTT